MSRLTRNRGFTILELMVALGLGLLVSAAATQLFVTNLQGFNIQRGMGDVQDNGRFALDFINRDVRGAGIRPAGSLDNPYPPVVIDIAQVPGATDATLTTSDGVSTTGLGSSDQLVIQKLTLTDTVDCEGNAVAANRYMVSRYFLRKDDASGSASALACEGGSHDAVTVDSFDGKNSVVLLGSAENMQVMLGVGTGNTPTQYLRADEYVALPAPRPRVLAVRLGVMVASTDRTGGQMGTAPVLNVLDATVDDIPGDGRIRRVFVTSIALRNEML